MTWLDSEINKRINNPQWQKNMASKLKKAIAQKESQKKIRQVIFTSLGFFIFLISIAIYLNPKSKPTIEEIYETWLLDELIDEILYRYYPINYTSGK